MHQDSYPWQRKDIQGKKLFPKEELTSIKRERALFNNGFYHQFSFLERPSYFFVAFFMPYPAARQPASQRMSTPLRYGTKQLHPGAMKHHRS